MYCFQYDFLNDFIKLIIFERYIEKFLIKKILFILKNARKEKIL